MDWNEGAILCWNKQENVETAANQYHLAWFKN